MIIRLRSYVLNECLELKRDSEIGQPRLILFLDGKFAIIPSYDICYNNALYVGRTFYNANRHKTNLGMRADCLCAIVFLSGNLSFRLQHERMATGHYF